MGDRATLDGSLDEFLHAYPDILGLVKPHLSFSERMCLSLSSPLLRAKFRPKLLVCTEEPNIGGRLVTHDLVGMQQYSASDHPVNLDLFENNPSYRALSRLVGRIKRWNPRSRRCGYDVVSHAPPPNLILEWQVDPHLQVHRPAESSDFQMTHCKHKRHIPDCPDMPPCPQPPPSPRDDKLFWVLPNDPSSNADLIYEDFMWGNWADVNLQQQRNADNPETCDDCQCIRLGDEIGDVLVMRRHRKFWVHSRLHGYSALLPDIYDNAEEESTGTSASRTVASHLCFEYTAHNGMLWVVGMPGQKIASSRSANNDHNIGHAHRTPLYRFPLRKYVKALHAIFRADGNDAGLKRLKGGYHARLAAACHWARNALRGISPLYIRHPHLIVCLDTHLHPVQRIAFVHLITTIANGNCIFRDDLRWSRVQSRVGFPRDTAANNQRWNRNATALVPSEDAMLVYTQPAKLHFRIVCTRSGQASQVIALPEQIGRGVFLVPPVVTG